jgi:hypothetical protein
MNERLADLVRREWGEDSVERFVDEVLAALVSVADYTMTQQGKDPHNGTIIKTEMSDGSRWDIEVTKMGGQADE